MIALITILIILGVILITAVLLVFVGNASIHITSQDQLRAWISICGIKYTIYPDKKELERTTAKKLVDCRDPEAILEREVKRRQQEGEKAARKRLRDIKRAKKNRKNLITPKKYFATPNLKENLEMILALAKTLVRKTRGKVKIKINKLHIRVATNDAAHTALLYGVVVQLLSYLFGFIEEKYTSIQRNDGDLVVEPDYTTSESSAIIDLILSAKIWRAIIIIMEMTDAYDAERKKAYRKAARRARELRTQQSRFNLKNILTRIRKDHSLWKTNLLSRK